MKLFVFLFFIGLVSISYGQYNDLGGHIGNIVRESLNIPSNYLGPNLGQSINNIVKDSLALASVNWVKTGRKGRTVVKFKDNRQFIVRDNIYYTCDGVISDTTGQCSGATKIFNFNKNEDYCYMDPAIRADNMLCFGPSSVSLRIVGGVVECTTHDGSRAFMIETNKYTNMCKDIAGTADYIFYPDHNVQVSTTINCSGGLDRRCTYVERSRPNYSYSYTYNSPRNPSYSYSYSYPGYSYSYSYKK